MFKFNNAHIFTGYLKQLLSSVNLPTCKIYTREFTEYLRQHGREDPRVVESINTINQSRLAARINYLKDNEIYNYFCEFSDKVDDFGHNKTHWRKVSSTFYNSENPIHGLTKTLYSPGSFYDTATHEYLGEYLRFLRDYHDINLMSLYNCFNNKTCNNVYKTFNIGNKTVVFDSQDPNYRIYAIPVKLFADYTVAIDSHHGVEMFCGLYSAGLDKTDKSDDLIKRTYAKVNKAIFKQPFIYNKLNVEFWNFAADVKTSEHFMNDKVITRWDIINREQDLKLFIKVPVSSRSSVVVLEGDFSCFNDTLYLPSTEKNLVMSNCSAGSKITLRTLTGEPPAVLRNYRIEPWKAAYYKADPSAGEESGGIGSILPAIECFENSADASVWSGGFVAPTALDENGWCKITCGEELAWVIQNGGSITINDKNVKHFILTNDIYLNAVTKVDWLSGELLDTDYSIKTWLANTKDSNIKAFCGTINGNGHVVHGLYADNSAQGSCVGLLPIIDAGGKTVIQNLGINHAYLRGDNVSAFVGTTFVDATSTVKSKIDPWQYSQNHSIINFGSKNESKVDVNVGGFVPISKLQLLEYNTGESYPFADRLIEYLSGSAITPIDEIPDNIKRAQRVMKQNQYRFKIEGLWENKMQKIIYDYIINAGPITASDGKLVDKRLGYHQTLGHNYKSTLYDILGYVDKDAEKWYASWTTDSDSKVKLRDSIQNVDIYVDKNGKSLWDI